MSAQFENGEEHWTKKGAVPLFLWRKTNTHPEAGKEVILWIHGSSMASQPTFDLQIPGQPDSSVMQWFGERGFDCWTFDHEGYGRSGKDRPVNADLANGVDDIVAAVNYIKSHTGATQILMYGISSGALKAAMYAALYPENLKRLALEAFVWTGKDSPTLIERAKKLPQWEGALRRPITREDLFRIFSRDKEGLVDQKNLEHFAAAVLSLDDSMPNGTYVDMCSKLPVVNPEAIVVPTLILRGEFDGIATLDDVTQFFTRISCMNKQFCVLQDVGHASLQGLNSQVTYHLLYSFFTQPDTHSPF